ERSICEQIDAIGFAAYPNRAEAVRCLEPEFASQLVFEQSLDDSGWTLGLHAEHRFAEPGGRGRSEESRPLEPPLGLRQRFERLVDDSHEHRPSVVEISGGDSTLTSGLPRREEALENLVDELPLAPRIHDLLVVRLFFELQDVLREEAERTTKVRFERANGPH